MHLSASFSANRVHRNNYQWDGNGFWSHDHRHHWSWQLTIGQRTNSCDSSQPFQKKSSLSTVGDSELVTSNYHLYEGIGGDCQGGKGGSGVRGGPKVRWRGGRSRSGLNSGSPLIHYCTKMAQKYHCTALQLYIRSQSTPGGKT